MGNPLEMNTCSESGTVRLQLEFDWKSTDIQMEKVELATGNPSENELEMKVRLICGFFASLMRGETSLPKLRLLLCNPAAKKGKRKKEHVNRSSVGCKANWKQSGGEQETISWKNGRRKNHETSRTKDLIKGSSKFYLPRWSVVSLRMQTKIDEQGKKTNKKKTEQGEHREIECIREWETQTHK